MGTVWSSSIPMAGSPLPRRLPGLSTKGLTPLTLAKAVWPQPPPRDSGWKLLGAVGLNGARASTCTRTGARKRHGGSFHSLAFGRCTSPFLLIRWRGNVLWLACSVARDTRAAPATTIPPEGCRAPLRGGGSPACRPAGRRAVRHCRGRTGRGRPEAGSRAVRIRTGFRRRAMSRGRLAGLGMSFRGSGGILRPEVFVKHIWLPGKPANPGPGSGDRPITPRGRRQRLPQEP